LLSLAPAFACHGAGLATISADASAAGHLKPDPVSSSSSPVPEASSPALLLPTAASTDADRDAAARGESAFAARLYARLNATDHGNLFFSPTSIRMALAMAWAGARGDTAREMATVLALDGDAAAIHRGFAGELRDLANASAIDVPADAPAWQRQHAERRQTVRLHIVNRLWGQRGRPFDSGYLALLAADYGAPLAPLDFAHDPEKARVTINGFVDDATEHRIPDLIPPQALSGDTKLVLTNAVYFKAQWQEQFSADATQTGDFRVSATKTVRAPLMQLSRAFRYGTFDGVQLLELPYASGTMSMVVALPEVDALAKVERAMSDGTLPSWVNALGLRRVNVALPRFKTTGDFSLAPVLAKVGMKSAFVHGPADFSGIDGTRELYLSDVVHRAFVAVDENGTEAAAATAVVGAGGGAPAEAVDFRADHPFLFFVRDTKSGAILFMGRIEDPTT
jgi:serpin B